MDFFWGATGIGIAAFLVIIALGIAAFLANNLEIKINK